MARGRPRIPMDCVTTAASQLACNRAGIPMDRFIAAALYLQPCQSSVTVGLCYGCLWWGTWGATELRDAVCDPEDAAAAGSCAERWRFLL